jgi:hypothetical protein
MTPWATAHADGRGRKSGQLGRHDQELRNLPPAGNRITREISPELGAFRFEHRGVGPAHPHGPGGKQHGGNDQPAGRPHPKNSRGMDRPHRQGDDSPCAAAARGRRAEPGNHHVGCGNAHHVRPRSLRHGQAAPGIQSPTARSISAITTRATCTSWIPKRTPTTPCICRYATTELTAALRYAHQTMAYPSLYWGRPS